MKKFKIFPGVTFLVCIIIFGSTYKKDLSSFKNSIVSGNKCNNFGFEQYIQNGDGSAAYSVTIRVDQSTPGVGSSQFQKVFQVPAGGRTYAGCSISAVATNPPTYTYTVIGESKL